jgi:7-cyano-7-deazaguanine synthase
MRNLNDRALVVLSGGLDSATLLYSMQRAGGEVFAVTFDYGQRHNVEIEHAVALGQAAGIGQRHFIVDISDIGANLMSSQTQDDIEVPHGHYTDETMKVTVVPNRNMIMLSIAAGIAISNEISNIAYAAHGGDHAIYPDCRPEFVAAMSQALFLADERKVALLAPFINYTKADIVKVGAELGVPFNLTWSCYEGGEKHCGKCGTCVERIEAFKLAGVKDPTEYE